MALELSYKQLEDLLALLHSISDDQRVALQGRVKHFQRNGWPGGTNTGKGRAAKYEFGGVMRLCLGFELLQIGLSPERAASVLRENWDIVRTALGLAFSVHEQNERVKEPFEVFIYCDPQGLSRLSSTNDDEYDPTSETFFYSSSPQLARAMLDNRDSLPRRLALINLSLLIGEIRSALNLLFSTLNYHFDVWEASEREEEIADTPQAISTWDPESGRWLPKKEQR